MSEKIINEIKSYADFPTGWDGYEGKTFTPGVIELAAIIAEEVRFERVHIAEVIHGPASDGTIELEFRLCDGRVFFVAVREETKP